MTFHRSLVLLAFAAGCIPETQDDTGADVSGVSCEGDVCVLSGVITDDLTLTADKSWILRGGVFVGDDLTETVLTVEPGTTVYGEASTDGMLVVRRYSKLVADGTAAAPIVFTSTKEPGTRSRGDWGGIVLNGRATLNSCDGEGTCEAYGEGGTGWYGGDDDADGSGVLRYVRVEFAGTLISPDNELNGIALQGCGRGTVLDHVQVHQNADDGIEFFGGTADARHLLITGAGDDGLDWTDGWRGRAQFVIVQQYADTADNGIEADNNAEQNDAAPRSSPTLSNVTLIGSPDSASSDVGVLLREGTAGAIHNAVVLGFNDVCVQVSDDASVAEVAAGRLAMTHSIAWGCGDATTYPARDHYTDANAAVMFAAPGADNRTVDPLLGAPFDERTPDFAPAATSPALTGGAAPDDAFFTPTAFVGAVGPSDDWTAGWTTGEAN